jgi:hypothetical protein
MPATFDIALPTIHLNGTSAQALFDANLTAMQAVEHAIDTLAQAAPNGRDFYVQGPDAFARARHEHQERQRLLNRIAMELAQIANHAHKHI